MARQRTMLLPLLSVVLSVNLAAKRPVADRVRSLNLSQRDRTRDTHVRARLEDIGDSHPNTSPACYFVIA